MFQFLTHVELSRSMAAILERPQYVTYQKNVVYAFIKLSEKSHSLTFCAQWMVLAALLNDEYCGNVKLLCWPRMMKWIAGLPGGVEHDVIKILNFSAIQCLFVCLFNRSLRVETHLGPDGTRPEQNAQARLKSLYKHAGQLVYENLKRETDLKI